MVHQINLFANYSTSSNNDVNNVPVNGTKLKCYRWLTFTVNHPQKRIRGFKDTIVSLIKTTKPLRVRCLDNPLLTPFFEKVIIRKVNTPYDEFEYDDEKKTPSYKSSLIYKIANILIITPLFVGPRTFITEILKTRMQNDMPLEKATYRDGPELVHSDLFEVFYTNPLSDNSPFKKFSRYNDKFPWTQNAACISHNKHYLTRLQKIYYSAILLTSPIFLPIAPLANLNADKIWQHVDTFIWGGTDKEQNTDDNYSMTEDEEFITLSRIE